MAFGSRHFNEDSIINYIWWHVDENWNLNQTKLDYWSYCVYLCIYTFTFLFFPFGFPKDFHIWQVLVLWLRPYLQAPSRGFLLGLLGRNDRNASGWDFNPPQRDDPNMIPTGVGGWFIGVYPGEIWFAPDPICKLRKDRLPCGKALSTDYGTRQWSNMATTNRIQYEYEEVR